ncbi:LuxR C-terminal-related transcriptional regulator [Streptomyces sp. NPDC059881]|uniref:LuxR C-terminal-related transcriptional regulator n=1 Tax=Streptomyces sp. NPDC059881 TaxID=3346986 RepID=UPI003655DB19
MTDSAEGASARQRLEVSDEARELYERGQLNNGDLHVLADEPGLDELLEKGLAVRNIWAKDMYLIQSLSDIWKSLVHREVGTIADAVRRIEEVRDFVANMPNQATSAGEGGIEFMDNKGSANGAIQRALDAAQTEVWTSHPHDRDEETMRKSLPEDLKRLDKGIGLRTIYPDTARSRKGEAMWASEVTCRGAEVRTAPGGFLRIVAVDDAFAMIPDHRPGRLSRMTAWRITHPGMMAVLREIYEQQWAQAEPWKGGHVRPVQEGTMTTQMQRKIMRDMSAGRSQAQIADRLGISVRSVQLHLRSLYDSLGITPGDAFRLGEFWRDTQERFLP